MYSNIVVFYYHGNNANLIVNVMCKRTTTIIFNLSMFYLCMIWGVNIFFF